MSGARMIMGDPMPKISVVTTKTLRPTPREQTQITEQVVIVDAEDAGNIVRHQEVEVPKPKSIKVKGASVKMRRTRGSLYY